MTFVSGAYTLQELLTEIATNLNSVDNWEIVDNAYPATLGTAYVLRYIPDDIYLVMELHNRMYLGLYYSSSSDYPTSAGIAITFYESYNVETHVGSGSYYHGALPLYQYYTTTGITDATVTGSTTYPVSYWYDKYGIIGVIQNQSGDYYSSGVFFALESVPSSWCETTDGNSHIVLHVMRNYNTYYSYSTSYIKPGDDNITSYYYHNVRPFIRASQSPIVNYSAIRYAYLAGSDSNVYCDMPIYHNDSSDYITPIIRSMRWFPVALSSGLGDGDLIQITDIDGVTVRTFIVCNVSSPDTTTILKYAIPYANAFDYGST